MGCGVCAHRERAAIEAKASVTDAPLRELAVQYGLSARSLEKHINQHPRAAAASSDDAPPSPPKRGRRRRAISSEDDRPVRNALVALPPPEPEPLASPTTVEQAPRDDDEEGPATSRSHELAAKPRTARERLENVLDSIETILEEVNRDKDVSAARKLEVLRSLVSPIRLLGHFTGEVGASESTVAASPFYRRVRKAIVEALSRKEFASAADAVIAALERIEGVQVERTTEAAAE